MADVIKRKQSLLPSPHRATQNEIYYKLGSIEAQLSVFAQELAKQTEYQNTLDEKLALRVKDLEAWQLKVNTRAGTIATFFGIAASSLVLIADKYIFPIVQKVISLGI